MKKMSTKKMVMVAMLTALSYTLVICIRIPLIPAAPFLEYNPSDIAIAIGAMIFGPLAALIMAIAVPCLEFITISDSGYVGLVMNILSTTAFVLPIALLYRLRKTKWLVIDIVTKTKKKEFKIDANSILSFFVGIISVTVVMVVFNILITPLYMKVPREVIVSMLWSAFIPFNAIKASINAIVAIGVYRSIHKFVEKNNYDK